MITDREKIIQIWKQANVPVIYRRGTGYPLMIRLPYREDNRGWLKNEKRINPTWVKDKKHWECPKAWFNDLVNRALLRWGKLYIIQPFRDQEICAPACWNATGHECQCSCMGANHGSQSSGSDWFVVSDTFATRWESKELACRLLVAKKNK